MQMWRNAGIDTLQQQYPRAKKPAFPGVRPGITRRSTAVGLLRNGANTRGRLGVLQSRSMVGPAPFLPADRLLEGYLKVALTS